MNLKAYPLHRLPRYRCLWLCGPVSVMMKAEEEDARLWIRSSPACVGECCLFGPCGSSLKLTDFSNDTDLSVTNGRSAEELPRGRTGRFKQSAVWCLTEAKPGQSLTDGSSWCEPTSRSGSYGVWQIISTFHICTRPLRWNDANQVQNPWVIWHFLNTKSECADGFGKSVRGDLHISRTGRWDKIILF